MSNADLIASLDVIDEFLDDAAHFELADGSTVDITAVGAAVSLIRAAIAAREKRWHRWFAWRPVKIYATILGQQTSLKPFPPGHRGKVVWWQWIERRSHGNYWEYRRC